MIEGINSTIANSALVRVSAEQSSSTRPSSAPKDVPKAPYVSPHIEVDGNSNKAVLQIRDSNTGDVVRQFPSESRLQQLAAQEAEARRLEQSSDSQGAGGSVTSDGVQASISDQSQGSEVQAPSTGVSSAEALAASEALSVTSRAPTQSDTSSGVSVLA